MLVIYGICLYLLVAFCVAVGIVRFSSHAGSDGMILGLLWPVLLVGGAIGLAAAIVLGIPLGLFCGVLWLLVEGSEYLWKGSCWLVEAAATKLGAK